MPAYSVKVKFLAARARGQRFGCEVFSTGKNLRGRDTFGLRRNGREVLRGVQLREVEKFLRQLRRKPVAVRGQVGA
jgi:hypothetical protein